MKKQLLLLVVILLPMVARAASVEIDGIYYELVSKAKQATVKGAVLTSGNLIIPASVTYEEVEYSVTSIGSEAFKGRSMTSVTIPNSVSSIGENAFQGCSGLTSVHISDIAAWCRISFGSGYANPLHCAHHLYLGDEEIKDLVIPNGVTSIERLAFWGCSGLTSVTIPGSVTKIGDSTFYGCNGLTAVHISDIGAWCKISFIQSSNPLKLARHLFLNGEEVKDLVIPNSVTSIEGDAFYGCTGLTSVTIGNSVTSIGNAAFYGCTGLTSVCIGNGVTSIGHSAFSGCSGLTSVTLGSSVTSIDNNAFSECSDLTSVTLPNSVTHIGCEAFYGCSSLTSVTIPNSVTLIRDYTFYGCNALTSITIGSGVNTIGTQAFANCLELTDVYCYAENVPNMRLTDYLSIFYTDAFYGSLIEYATLHVPTTSIDAYKAKEPWKNFKSIVGLDGTITEPQKCATPTISYQNGQITFYCETENVQFSSSITDADIKSYSTETIQLDVTYNISVYATKSGYDNSDVATATLCWIDATPQTEGITDGVAQVSARPVLVKTGNGVITVEGVDDRTNVSVYTTDGKQAGSAISQNNRATIATSIQPGSIAIVKVSEKSIKVTMK
jgi:hypothetical protein